MSSHITLNRLIHQESNTHLYIAAGFGGQIIGTSHPLAEDAEFFWFADGSRAPPITTSTRYSPGRHRVEQGDGGRQSPHRLGHGQRNADQEWVFDGSTSTGYWKNVGTNDVLKVTFDGDPVTTVRSESSTSSELWTFVTP